MEPAWIPDLPKVAVPEEYLRQEDSHYIWLPETTPEARIGSTWALNLRCPAMGMAGDWHPFWTVPVEGVPDRAHTCSTSSDLLLGRDGGQVLLDIVGTDQIVDARPGLADIGHPAAGRTCPVWASTHVLAVIEMAWHAVWCYSTPPERIADCPRSIAIWLTTQEQWRILDDRCERIRLALVDEPERQAAWAAWRSTLTPRVLADGINARWTTLKRELTWIEAEQQRLMEEWQNLGVGQ